MRVIHAAEEPDYGFALGSVLVSLLEPAAGQERALHRWYERDHFYSGCMVGPSFFAGRRFVATRDLKALRYPASSSSVPDTSIGSYLALYLLERGHEQEAERWAVDRVRWLHEQNRMARHVERELVHASFYSHRWAACRDLDGVPPELALEHPFAGLVLMLCERPEGVVAAARDRWLLESELPALLAGSDAALCLSLASRELPPDSPAWAPPEPGSERRSLEIFFLERDPREVWQELFASFGERQAAAGMGEVALAAGFVPTIPGTDRYTDEI